MAAGVALAPFASAAPQDPFASGPTRDFSAPEGQRFAPAGQASEQTGDASYTIPIEVPPGRLGMQPSLALGYSSSGALRGGLAVGWSLDLPMIERDPEFPLLVRYRVDGKRLIRDYTDPMGGEVYRTEVDGSFTRYQKTALGWTVLTTDGHTLSFNRAAQHRWMITENRDAMGNAVRYTYSTVSVNGALEQVPTAIDYSANDAAGIAAHAKVDFVYAPLESCGGAPIGAAFDFRFGIPRVAGARRLTEIRTSVRDTSASAWRTTKSVRLGYDSAQLACSASAMRYLTTIDITGYTATGAATTQPTVRFAYGDAQRSLGRSIALTGAPREWGNIDGAKSGFMDLDGDSRNDFVEVLTEDRCRFRVRRGLPDGQFAPVPYTIDMPSAAWGGGPTPGEPLERCTLGGQLAMRYRSQPLQIPTCRIESVKVNYHFVDYDGDGRTDLLTALSGIPSTAGGDFAGAPNAHQDQTQSPAGCPSGTVETSRETIDGVTVVHCGCANQEQVYDPMLGYCSSPAPTCPPGTHPDYLGGCWGAGPGGIGGGGAGTDPTVGNCTAPRDGFEVAGSSTVWRLQRNIGGTFAPLSAATRIDAPKPLPESASVLASERSSTPSLPVLIDLDGDGRLDVVSLYLGNSPPANAQNTPRLGRDPLWVWKGNTDGTFAAPVQWVFPSPFSMANNRVWSSAAGVRPQLIDGITESTLIDVNQDRLPDLVFRAGPALYVSYNQAGYGVNAGPPAIGGAFSAPVELKSPLLTSFDTPVAQARSEIMHDWAESDLWLDGVRAGTRMFEDLDGDGLPELTMFSVAGSGVASAATSRLAYRMTNGATSFRLGIGLGAEWEALESRVTAANGRWSRNNDFLDLTGDGLPDAVYWMNDRIDTATIFTDAAPSSSRLLTMIDNGRGGVTRFEYAMANDASVVALGGAQTDARRVVKKTTVEPGYGQPAIISAYQYADPVTAPSGPGRMPSFLGYRSATIDRSGQTGTASQRTIATYDYSPLGKDWGGRIASRASFVFAAGAWTPVAHEKFVYGTVPLLGGAGSMTYTARTEHRVCAVSSTAAGCAAQPDALVSTHDYSPWPAVGTPVLYMNTVTRTLAPNEIERYTRNAYEVRYTATTTRIFATSSDRGWALVWDPWLYIPYERIDTTYDARGLPTERRDYQTGTTIAVTRTTFDAVGQPTRVVRPRQVALGGSLGLTFEYDAFRVHPASMVDELSRVTLTKTDLASGQPVEVQGPDARPTCNGCTTTVFQTQRFARDGFGRVTAHERGFDPAAGQSGYVQRTDKVVAYLDFEQPARIVTSQLKDAAAGSWITDEATVDGTGRTLSTTARRNVAGGTDAVTLYRYDSGGGLAAVETPDPRYDNGARLTTTFTRDGAGRVLSVTRPDGSHQDIAYRGLETEIANVGGGTRERTIQRKTLFGELVEIQELDNPQPGQVAVTRYVRDAMGRVMEMRDSENDLTAIGYNWNGQRVSVTRNGRSWWFDYDLDGNSVATTEPVPTGAAINAYRTTTSYDPVGRATSTIYASHGMSSERMTELGIGVTSMAYRPLTDQVASITLPFGTVTKTYDASGNVAREQRILRTPATGWVTQTVDRTYDAIGNAQTVLWDDGVGYKITTDTRGAVASVAWRSSGMAAGSYETLATYTRAVAGQPRTRSGLGQQRDWTYDQFGRVTYDRVSRPGFSGSLSELNVYYDELGNISGRRATAPGLVEDTSFTYDAVHRLTGAIGANGYEARYTYSSAGNLRSALVRGTDADRDVDYAYGAVDLQAVDRLTDRKTGAVVGSFDYDTAGQMVRRQTSAGSTAMSWDANGVLRETANANEVSRTFVGPGAERMIGVDSTGTTLWFDDSETLIGLNGAVVRRYHHLAAGEPIARIENASTVELQYADTMQNLRLTAARNGAVTAAFTYGAFGEVLGSIGAADHARQFNGKDAERVAGLRNYGFRSYDPFTLRWVSADPVASMVPDTTAPQLANRYSFSANNPVRYLDPDGLAPCTIRLFGVCPPAPDPAPVVTVPKGSLVVSGAVTPNSASAAFGADFDDETHQKAVGWLESLRNSLSVERFRTGKREAYSNLIITTELTVNVTAEELVAFDQDMNVVQQMNFQASRTDTTARMIERSLELGGKVGIEGEVPDLGKLSAEINGKGTRKSGTTKTVSEVLMSGGATSNAFATRIAKTRIVGEAMLVKNLVVNGAIVVSIPVASMGRVVIESPMVTRP